MIIAGLKAEIKEVRHGEGEDSYEGVGGGVEKVVTGPINQMKIYAKTTE